MDTQRTAVVGSCTSRPEAELQRHVLEESGIPTSIGSDDAGGLHPELAFTRCATYRIIVPASEVERAREILADFEPDEPRVDVVAGDLRGGDLPGDAASDAEVGLGSNVMFWVALVLAAIVIGAAVGNALNVFTAG